MSTEAINPPEPEEGPRSFAHFLAKLGYGDAHRELSQELHTLISLMQDESLNRNTKVTGSLGITFKFSVDERGVAAVAYEVKRKDPTKKTSASVFWVTQGGNLTSTDPRQVSLDLREVNNTQGPAREVGGEVEQRNV